MLKLFFNILFIIIILTPIGQSYNDIINPHQIIPLYLKISSYDENFIFDRSHDVNLFVIYDIKDTKSYEQYIKTKEYFDKNHNLSVNKSKVIFTSLKIDESSELREYKGSDDYTIVIFTAISIKNSKSVLDIIKGLHFHTFSYDPALVKVGVSVSIRPLKKDSPILINLRGTLEEGSRYSAHLLKMCEIYED